MDSAWLRLRLGQDGCDEFVESFRVLLRVDGGNLRTSLRRGKQKAMRENVEMVLTVSSEGCRIQLNPMDNKIKVAGPQGLLFRHSDSAVS